MIYLFRDHLQGVMCVYVCVPWGKFQTKRNKILLPIKGARLSLQDDRIHGCQQMEQPHIQITNSNKYKNLSGKRFNREMKLHIGISKC